MSQTLQYPNDKIVAGKAYWQTIHNIAAQYPNYPTTNDKVKAKNFFTYLIDNFVCNECTNHAKEYIKKHEPDYSSKKALSKYFCDFHNHVNNKLGKPIVNCDLILNGNVNHDKATCPTCKVGGIKKNFDELKTSARNLILNMCKEENVEPPAIHFTPCPDNTSTSCLVYDANKMHDGVYVGNADIFINPYSASFRTIGHETKHYIDLKKGNPITEGPADDYAIEKINKHFDFDTYKNESAPNNKVMDEATNIVDTSGNNITVTSLNNDIFVKPNPTSYKNLGLTTHFDYPSLNRINNMLDSTPPKKGIAGDVEEQATGPVENVLSAENTDDFLLSGLNKIFEWPASLVGVKASSLNQMYVGSFVTSVLQYLIASNLSTFGASTFSLFTAVSTFIASAIFKNSISPGDRVVIQGVIAMFLASGINSLVPQKREVMAEGLRLFVEGIKEMNLDKLKQAFFFDEKAFSIQKSINTPDPSKQTVFKNDVSNAYIGIDGVPQNPSMMVNPTRRTQLGSQRDYDARVAPNNYMSGDKNTVAPNYTNSTLEAIANSYARKRQLPTGGSGNVSQNLEGIDLNQLTEELNEIADMNIDANTYEILPM